MSKKNSKTKPGNQAKRDRYLWLGGAIGVLFLIVLLIVIPNANHNNSAPRSTNTTEQTEDISEPPEENDETEPDPTEPVTVPDPTPPESTQPSSQPTPTLQTPTTYNATPTCLHEEAGRCWDDLEDEAYSAGAYDHEFGYYGASLDYADDCDALCRDILEDAYDEGWADARY